MAFIDPDNPLAAEILREAGETYFSGCKRMVASLEELRAFDRVIAPSGHDGEHVTRRSQLLDDAAERVHFVLIQRDALQLSRSETFFEDYGVPADVIARLGKRQPK